MDEKKKTEPGRGFPPGVAFIDGDFCDISEARISILDFGFLHSDATYDVVHVWRRRFFRAPQVPSSAPKQICAFPARVFSGRCFFFLLFC